MPADSTSVCYLKFDLGRAGDSFDFEPELTRAPTAPEAGDAEAFPGADAGADPRIHVWEKTQELSGDYDFLLEVAGVTPDAPAQAGWLTA